MLDIGMPEFLLIAAIALIVVGPDKLPDIAKTIGRMFGELKKTTNEFKKTMEAEIQLNEANDIDEKEIIDKAEIININEQDKIGIASMSDEDKTKHKDEVGCGNESCLEKEQTKGTIKDERG